MDFSSVSIWDETTLGECADWFSGGTPSTTEPEYWDGAIPWITASSLHEFYLWDSERRITELGLQNGSRLMPQNAIIFVVRGMSLKSEFRVGIAMRPMAFGQDCKSIIAKDGVDSRFLANVLRAKAPEILGLVDEASHGTGRLQTQALQQLSVPLPPLKEQQAIACILGALDDKIELNRRMNRTLEAMARALFQSWFVDFDAVRAKLALNGAEGAAGLKPAIAALFPDRLVAVDGREMPEGWKLTTLGDVTAKHGGLIQTGPFGSQLHASDYVEAGIPTIMPKDISDRRVHTEKIAYIDEADAARLGRHRVAPGDIVYSRRGDVERHALIGKREQGWLCGTGCMLVRPGARWPSPLFMSLHLDRPDIKEWITQHAIGATMPNLNTSVLGQVPILAPSHTILKAFEVLAGPLDEKSADNDRQSRTLAALRDTLLPKLISGALRVADAERIVGRCVS